MKKVSFTKESRFAGKDEKKPGPGSYEGGGQAWNKKTFNLKFLYV
jgi:hypothetical protein